MTEKPKRKNYERDLKLYNLHKKHPDIYVYELATRFGMSASNALQSIAKVKEELKQQGLL